MKILRLKHQTGFSLLEMIIAISLMAILIGVVAISLGQERRHAEMLHQRLQLVQSALLRFETDFPCGANSLAALVRRDQAAAGLCGEANNLEHWRGPYLDAYGDYSLSGDLDLAAIVPGVSMGISQTVISDTYYTIVSLKNINNELRVNIIDRCGDECLPYKNLNGDVTTVGLLVSTTKTQPLLNPTYELTPLPGVVH